LPVCSLTGLNHLVTINPESILNCNTNNATDVFEEHYFNALNRHKEPGLGQIFSVSVDTFLGRAIAQRLVAGFPPRRPVFEPGSDLVGFVVDKVMLV
jgi:hypothetical protein